MLRHSWSTRHYFLSLFVTILCAAVGGALLNFWTLPYLEGPIVSIRKWLLVEANLKIAGFLITLLFGTIPLVRNWLYRIDRWPGKLNEYLTLCRQSLLRERDVLVSAVASSVPPAPPAATWWGRRQQFRASREMADYIAQLDRAPLDAEDESRQLQDRFEVSAKAHQIATIDKATHHYVRALDYLRLASSRHDADATRSKMLNELKQATDLDRCDHRLHRMYVYQLAQSGRTSALSDAIANWTDAAKASNAAREQGVSEAFHGAFLLERIEDPNLSETSRSAYLKTARDLLEYAVRRIGQNPRTGGTAETDEELGKALENLGDVQRRRGTDQAARIAYQKAREIFGRLLDGVSVPRLDGKLAGLGVVVANTVTRNTHVMVIQSKVATGRALLAANEPVAARAELATARVRLIALSVPDQIEAQLQQELLAELAELIPS